MGRQGSPSLLDSMLLTVNALSLLKGSSRKRPTIKRTISTRQIYDQKTHQIITLKNESTTFTEELYEGRY